MESIICEVIVQHVKINLLDADEQHGFNKGKSTATNLLASLDNWTNAMQDNIPIDIIYLDYIQRLLTPYPMKDY